MAQQKNSGRFAPRSVPWFWIGLILVLLCAGDLRLRYAMRADVYPDEMLHLPSYRNHYGTQDVFPVFKARLDAPGGVSGKVKPLLRRYYALGPLAQRSLLVFTDGQPVAHPVLLESIQALTYDSLATMRAISLLASLAAVWLAFQFGKELGDAGTGLLIAGMLAIDVWTSHYGGVARTYAFLGLGFFTLMLTTLRAARSDRAVTPQTLAAALFCQTIHWLAWPIVGTTLIGLIVADLRQGVRPLRLLRTGWWYVAGSLLLLLYLKAQSLNPTLATVGTLKFSPALSLSLYGWVAPTGTLGFLSERLVSWGGLVSLAVAVLGAVVCGRVVKDDRVRWLCVFMPALGSLLVLLMTPGEQRYWLTMALPIIVLIALGLRWLLGEHRGALAAVALAVAGCAVQVLVPEERNPTLKDLLPGFAATSGTLRSELANTGRWISYPYFLADSYYRFASSLPPPIQPQSPAEFEQLLKSGAPATIMMFSDTVLPPGVKTRIQAVQRITADTSLYRLTAAGP